MNVVSSKLKTEFGLLYLKFVVQLEFSVVAILGELRFIEIAAFSGKNIGNEM